MNATSEERVSIPIHFADQQITVIEPQTFAGPNNFTTELWFD